MFCWKPRAPARPPGLLGAVMKAKKGAKHTEPSLLDVVALLKDFPAQRLARGQVGTIVEEAVAARSA